LSRSSGTGAILPTLPRNEYLYEYLVERLVPSQRDRCNIANTLREEFSYYYVVERVVPSQRDRCNIANTLPPELIVDIFPADSSGE
jgi:hypothetical protein